MNKKRVKYIAIASFLSVASCTKEATEPNIYDPSDGVLYFKTSLSDVSTTKAQDVTIDKLESFQVTCFKTLDYEKDAAGIIKPHFEDATFIRHINIDGSISYVDLPSAESHDWPERNHVLKFYTFSPSCEVMRADNPDIPEETKNDYFHLFNNSTERNSQAAIDYRLGIIRVNPDISKQFDFMTAYATGRRYGEFSNGVPLDYSHQMCQIEFQAWGASTDFDIEIAGVRIGNSTVEGTFIFSDGSSPEAGAHWADYGETVRDNVEYVYTGGSSGNGDKIFSITTEAHNSETTAESIMGLGGCAMLIPTINHKWEGLADPNINSKPYKTNRMYISLLIRVSSNNSGSLIYPYPGSSSKYSIVYFATDQDNNILHRLYRSSTADEYFTDKERTNRYVEKAGEEIKEFGWAAVPIDASWSAGKRYVYTLNYTDGLGVHDPSDPFPGTSILGTPVGVNVTVSDWKQGSEIPDVTVPRK